MCVAARWGTYHRGGLPLRGRRHLSQGPQPLGETNGTTLGFLQSMPEKSTQAITCLDSVPREVRPAMATTALCSLGLAVYCDVLFCTQCSSKWRLVGRPVHHTAAWPRGGAGAFLQRSLVLPASGTSLSASCHLPSLKMPCWPACLIARGGERIMAS